MTQDVEEGAGEFSGLPGAITLCFGYMISGEETNEGRLAACCWSASHMALCTLPGRSSENPFLLF